MSVIGQYLDSVNKKFISGISSEHSYRGEFEKLFKDLVSDLDITNEPSQVTECGNPDFVITKGKIPIGYIEAKDIGKDLKSKSYREQFTRYKNALDNLIITDYLYFQFFQHGELVHEIRIAEIDKGKLFPIQDNYERFKNLMLNFSSFIGQTIKSPKRLAEMMAAKARLLQDTLERAVTSDEKTQENTSLKEQYNAFKEILIHNLKPDEFADLYAQTLAYGMFAARLHDTSLDDFSRQEASELIPKSNPFLRKLFGYVAGPEIDERIKTTVENLAEVFRATNVEKLINSFGSGTSQQDPIIHFYETFLAEYDPKLRKSRGVWYTPEPVVKFIVRAVDDILKTEFGLTKGLADTSKTEIEVDTQVEDKRSNTGYRKLKKEVHKVQILDPATGTGTFLAEIISHIFNSQFSNLQGAWSNYVDNHLIPRLNGFEILMASYSMAHLKLDMLLSEMGYESETNKRLNVYLTNSLEEYHKDTGTLFSSWLSKEANEANHIKRDTPIMCVVGNPPYAVSSNNKNDWISNLISDYKKDLDEKSYNSLSDDYVKFIRYGQYFIEKNETGILAYISNNSFIDGIVFRQMRKNLMEVFDKIYILDLHGSAKKKEVAPDGSSDENVFDIMQGVSINIFIKTGKKQSSNGVLHYDLFGKRGNKYKFLSEKSIHEVKWEQLKVNAPYYFFKPFDYETFEVYQNGFMVSDLFEVVVSGIQTEFDDLSLHKSHLDAEQKLYDLENMELNEFSSKYKYGNSKKQKLAKAISDVKKNEVEIVPLEYKVFSKKYSIYTGTTNGIMGRPRFETMRHMVNKDNIGLVTMRTQVDTTLPNTYFVSKYPIDKNYFGFQSYIFPIYKYPKLKENEFFNQRNREPNLNIEILNKIKSKVNLEFTSEKESSDDTFAPIDVLDFVYAVLYAKSYREKYSDFLKIDFPKIPYPKDKVSFLKLVKIGSKLRELHLLENYEQTQYVSNYPINGNNLITKKITKGSPGYVPIDALIGKVWINDTQYFDKVPLISWEFYIGGYQPAQKWLKDRVGEKLSFEDILHYQKIIVALSETDRLMKEIDKIEYQ